MNSNVVLIDDYIPYVHKVARLLSHSVPFVDFEDAIQDGLIGLMNAVQDFDPMRSVTFQSYAYKIIKRNITQGAVSLNQYKYNRKERVYEPAFFISSLDDEEVGDIADPKINGLQAMIRKENKKLLRLAIKILNKEEREVVDLHYFSGMKFCEISLLKNVTAARVSQIHKRALKKVREEMEKIS